MRVHGVNRDSTTSHLLTWPRTLTLKELPPVVSRAPPEPAATMVNEVGTCCAVNPVRPSPSAVHSFPSTASIVHTSRWADLPLFCSSRQSRSVSVRSM